MEGISRLAENRKCVQMFLTLLGSEKMVPDVWSPASYRIASALLENVGKPGASSCLKKHWRSRKTLLLLCYRTVRGISNGIYSLSYINIRLSMLSAELSDPRGRFNKPIIAATLSITLNLLRAGPCWPLYVQHYTILGVRHIMLYMCYIILWPFYVQDYAYTRRMVYHGDLTFLPCWSLGLY